MYTEEVLTKYFICPVRDPSRLSRRGKMHEKWEIECPRCGFRMPEPERGATVECPKCHLLITAKVGTLVLQEKDGSMPPLPARGGWLRRLFGL